MPRSGKVEKRTSISDFIYNSPLINKLINKIMVSGKKTLAQKIVYGALEEIRLSKQDPVKTLELAIENVTPKMEVRPRRVGGASYMVPLEVRGTRRMSLAINWLISAARSKSPSETKRLKNKPLMISKLSAEILEAAQNTGKAVTKKEEVHRMAEANKAFAHFRW